MDVGQHPHGREGIVNQSVAEPSAMTHPDGATLMAVAEGRADEQPSDEVLGHIFSCPECHGALQEIRTGLQAMGALSDVPATPAEGDASPWPAEMMMLESAGASDSSEIDPGRMVKKMAIGCVVVVVAMVLLRLWLSHMS